MGTLEKCELCPRACGVNRESRGRGRCHETTVVRVARVSLHMWEEACV